jgi:hypothetical protein
MLATRSYAESWPTAAGMRGERRGFVCPATVVTLVPSFAGEPAASGLPLATRSLLAWPKKGEKLRHPLLHRNAAKYQCQAATFHPSHSSNRLWRE